MNDNCFGLTRRPFPPMPDTALYYPSSLHESALGALTRGLQADESIVLLTGDAGTGKTLLGYLLLDRLGNSVVSAFLTNSHFADRASLLQAILYDLGLSHEGIHEQTLRLRLTDQLLKNCAEGKRTILVIDEAHHLNADQLEELRLLANLEAGDGKALQVVLLAQPSIHQSLNHPGLESLRQRIIVRPILDPLGVEEAYDYLLHHVRAAGGKPEKIFDDTALEVLAGGARGIPRCLNQAAQHAMRLAEEGELTKVDAEAAMEALSLLGMAPREATETEDTTEHEPTHPNIQKFMRTA